MAAHRFGEGVLLLEQYLAGKANSTAGRSGLSIALLSGGRYTEAAAAAESLPHEHPVYFVVRSVAGSRTGNRAKAAAILADMRRLVGKNGGYQYAEMLAAMGDKGGALAAL